MARVVSPSRSLRSSFMIRSGASEVARTPRMDFVCASQRVPLGCLCVLELITDGDPPPVLVARAHSAGRPLSSAPLESTWSLAVKRHGVQGVGGVLCNHGQLGHQAIMYELCLLAERGRDMEIFAATGTNAPPSAKHDRNPLLHIVTVLLPVATLPRTYCAKNKRDIPGAGSIHRPLRL